MTENHDITRVYTIFAGKFRRYHGESFLQHLADVATILKNIRDFFLLLLGLVQSFFLLIRLKPDAVFIKGGFVGVPIGYACALLRIPYSIHDSDTVPGLANKLISRWARVHATGMPTEFYATTPKLKYVGIPLAPEYTKVDADEQKKYRRTINVPETAQLICITGGSLGALQLNNAVHAVAAKLLTKNPDLYIFHQTGGQPDNLYADLPADLKNRVIEQSFVDNLFAYVGAADLVIARAGATTIAEIGAMHKACILVPGAQLTGGQQPKNAAHSQQKDAAVVITQQESLRTDQFFTAISDLLHDKQQRAVLAINLSRLIKTNAAAEIADMIINQAQDRS